MNYLTGSFGIYSRKKQRYSSSVPRWSFLWVTTCSTFSVYRRRLSPEIK